MERKNVDYSEYFIRTIYMEEVHMMVAVDSHGHKFEGNSSVNDLRMHRIAAEQLMDYWSSNTKLFHIPTDNRDMHLWSVVEQ